MNPRKRKPARKKPRRTSGHAVSETVGLRIIGGHFRGRKLDYSGDRRVRPMKDRVREAAFNLIGPGVRGTHAVDLFAGTGALGLEALSRGADRATFIEQHFPTAAILRKNIAHLGVEDRTTVFAGDVFLWAGGPPPTDNTRQVVFCSPPYEFYVSRLEQMLALVGNTMSRAPGGSILVVEADDRLDFALLPEADQFDVRRYSPALLGIFRKPG